MVVLSKSKIPKNFRVTIPKEVREFLDLKAGSEIIFYTIEGKKGRVCFRSIET